jgi:uncharacterized DUF497 family protein
MEFEWDDEKNKSNIKKHSISFEQAKAIFDYEILTKVDDRYNYGEIREISLGLLEGKTIIVVVHTQREGKIRIISARKANKEERETYNEHTKKNA